AHHQRIARHVARDHRASPHERITPDRRPTYDRTVRPEGRAPPHESRTQLLHPSDLAARIEDVGEHHRRPAEHAIFEGHSLVHGDDVLDLDPVTDRDVGADYDILSDPSVLAHSGSL